MIRLSHDKRWFNDRDTCQRLGGQHLSQSISDDEDLLQVLSSRPATNDEG